MVNRYIPAPGDLVWLEFDPQAGHEQAGHRPALVISHRDYNRKTGLGLFCPVTSKEKGYPFEVRLVGLSIQGVVLADQVKSLDWQTRKARLIEKVPLAILEEARAKVHVLTETAG
jgi:mRNA interferase MazF